MPLNLTPYSGKTSKVSTMPKKGLNNRTAPEFQSLEYAQTLENFTQSADGKMVKVPAKKLQKVFSGRISHVDSFDENYLVVCHDDKVSMYNVNTGLYDTIYQSTLSNDWSGFKFQDYYYLTNGEKPIYITYGYGPELYKAGQWEETFNTEGSGKVYTVFNRGDAVFFKLNGVGIPKNTGINFEAGSFYNFDLSVYYNQTPQSFKVTDPIDFTFVDVSGPVTTQVNKKFFVDSSNNLEARYIPQSISVSTQLAHTPTGVIDGVNKTFKVNNLYYYTGIDITVDGVYVSDTDAWELKGDILTLENAPTSSIIFRGDIIQQYGYFDVNSIKQQDRDSFVVDTITSAIPFNSISLYDNRMVGIGSNGFESLVKTSQAYLDDPYSITEVPFINWSGGSTPASPEDPVTFNYSDLGAARDAVQQGSQLVIFYDNGRRGVRISSRDDSQVGVIQQVFEDFVYRDAGGFKAVHTSRGVFYCNEKGIFLLPYEINSNYAVADPDIERSFILGDEEIKRYDFSAAEMAYDRINEKLYVSCNKDVTNRIVLCYDAVNASWSEIPEYDVCAMHVLGNTIYGGGNSDGTLYTLFEEDLTSFDTVKGVITQEYQMPVDSYGRMVDFTMKGFWNENSNITITFDIYDINRQYKQAVFTYSYGSGNVLIEELLADENGVQITDENDTAIIGTLDYDHNTLEKTLKIPVRFESFTRMKVTIEEDSAIGFGITYYKPTIIQQGANTKYTNI